MKNKLIALIYNLLLLAWSSNVFFTKGLARDAEMWRFLASLTGMLIFLGFFILIARSIIIHKRRSK